MIHLRSVGLAEEACASLGAGAAYPFSLPALRGLGSLDLAAPVTFFVGENGSGKSTVLEALAVAVGSVAAGSDRLEGDGSLAPVRPLADALRPVWNRRTRRGFFLRAEDFFGYVKRVKTDLAWHDREAARVRAETPGVSDGELARISAPFAGSAAELRGRYGADMDARSHGEQFLQFFQARVVPRGLYLLDEPEVPLSPSRQLALLAMLMERSSEHDCQFVIATHSPILLALPEARILEFDGEEVRAVAWEDLEHVRLTRDFLNRPDLFLRHLRG